MVDAGGESVGGSGVVDVAYPGVASIGFLANQSVSACDSDSCDARCMMHTVAIVAAQRVTLSVFS
jgi:hypothetical protein